MSPDGYLIKFTPIQVHVSVFCFFDQSPRLHERLAPYLRELRHRQFLKRVSWSKLFSAGALLADIRISMEKH
jgi:hypothetical protein